LKLEREKKIAGSAEGEDESDVAEVGGLSEGG